MLRIALISALSVLLLPNQISAQDDPAATDEAVSANRTDDKAVAERQLGIYTPKHLPAVDVARLVEQLMGDDVRVLPETITNRVLIRASAAKLKETKAVLDLLDQPPKMIAFDVVFADLPAAEDGKPSDGKTSDESWLARIKNRKDKSKGNISELRLTATENQKAMVQFGEETAIVTGVAQQFPGRGGRSSVTTRKQTGTLMQCTARVLDDQTIIAEFQIERSKMAPPEEATVLGESDDRGTLSSPGMLTTTCQTTLKLKPGKPRVISGLKSQGPSKGTQSVIVITAELISSE